MIRDFDPGDAAPVAALLREQDFPGPVSGAGVLHWLNVQPPRAHARTWIAEEQGLLAGWVRARLLWKTTVAGAAEIWGIVSRTYRGRGHGARLYDVAVDHLRRSDARELQSWSDEDGGRRFLERRGFRPARAERISILDVDTVMEAPKPPDGVRAAPLRDVKDRARELHSLYASAILDVPDIHAENDIRFEEWRRDELSHPQLSHEGSSVVLLDDRLAAFAFLAVDESARLAANDMTGTLEELRGRGLARLAKLETIRWAATNGYRTIVTTNDEANTAIIRLNESLGYRAVGIETQWIASL